MSRRQTPSRFGAVSVDLDEIVEYLAIHGLTESAVENPHVVYDVAVPRLLRWARELSLPLTLFVIARDLREPSARKVLQEASLVGHELANHSLDHRYDLTRLPRAEQRRQIVEAQDRLRDLTGEAPRGFRAPGYTNTDGLLYEIAEAGLRYDSSLFPCPPYYAAKAGILLAQRLVGRRSRAVLDHPSVLATSLEPSVRTIHRPGRPTRSLVELPIQVVTPLRLPFIGTSLTLAPGPVFRGLLRASEALPSCNLELHGLDFLEASDVPGPLARLQPDLRVSVATKLERLTEVVRSLRAHGTTFTTLEVWADSVRAAT
jgi:peptidoglycan-N-acetylglucosamine deacetylase